MPSPRADVAEVIALTGTDLGPEVVQLLLEDASIWVDNYLVGKCRGLADDKLEIIERYLAASFVKATEETDGQLVEAQRGDIREKYAEHGMGEGPGAVFLRRAAAFEPCGIVGEHFLGWNRFRARVGKGYATRGGP